MQQLSPMEVGIVVSDLDQMLAFYTGVLSCVEQRRSDIPAELSRALRAAPAGYINVWLKTPYGEIIKLVKPPTAPFSGKAPEFSSARTGFAYLTFYCAEIEKVLAIAKAQGAIVRSDDWTLSGSIGLKLVFFEDPEGNVIELVEPKSA
jgi:catechol 2,3-dioxygenase-like lactoylglutathione lyase family enzyme